MGHGAETQKNEGKAITNNRIPKYARPAVKPPTIREGELVVVENIQIKFSVKGDYGLQYQFDGNVRGTEFNARAWIKEYDNPTVKTKIVKLCMLVEDYTGQEFDTIEGALNALTSIGRMYFQCTGHNEQDDGTKYPKFMVNVGSIPEPEPQQSKIQHTQPKPTVEDQKKYDSIVKRILETKPSLTMEAIEKLIEEEKTKAAGLLTNTAAAYLISTSLGVKLEE